MKFSWRLRVAPVVIGVLVSACGSGSSSEPSSENADVITVATAFYPITEIVSRVTTGTNVEIVSLTPPGIGAHDHQLTARQVDELADADAVFYLGGGIQPTVEKAVAQLPASLPVVNLLNSAQTIESDANFAHNDHADEETHNAEEAIDDEHNDGEIDPHVWLDPANMMLMTQTVLMTLSEISPENKDAFTTNATSYVDELETLGKEIDTTFATCTSRALVTSHDAFGYFAARAQLTTVPIAGVNPENEPSAKELETIADIAKDSQASTVFFEALLPDGLAKTVAENINANIDVIDPIETLSENALANGADYISTQRLNIEKISRGLGCS